MTHHLFSSLPGSPRFGIIRNIWTIMSRTKTASTSRPTTKIGSAVVSGGGMNATSSGVKTLTKRSVHAVMLSHTAMYSVFGFSRNHAFGVWTSFVACSSAIASCIP